MDKIKRKSTNMQIIHWIAICVMVPLYMTILENLPQLVRWIYKALFK